MRAHDRTPDAVQSWRPAHSAARRGGVGESSVVARAARHGVGSPQDILALQRSVGNAAVTQAVTAQAQGGTVQRAPGSSSDTGQQLTKEEAFGSWLRSQEGYVASAFRSGYLKLQRFGGPGKDEALLEAASRKGVKGSKWRSMGEEEFSHLQRTNVLPQNPHYGGLSPDRGYAASSTYFSHTKGRYLVQFLVEDAEDGRTYEDVMRNGNVGGKADGAIVSHGLGLRATPASAGGVRRDEVTKPDGTSEIQSRALREFNANLEDGQFHWFLDSTWLHVPPDVFKS